MVDTELVKFERVNNLKNIPSEAEYRQIEPVKNFASKGKIDFLNLKLKYMKELPLVIKGVSMTI